LVLRYNFLKILWDDDYFTFCSWRVVHHFSWPHRCQSPSGIMGSGGVLAASAVRGGTGRPGDTFLQANLEDAFVHSHGHPRSEGRAASFSFSIIN
jgi:hypothetical protein